MTEDEKLDQLLNALKAGEPVKGSTSELCAVVLAAERPELLRRRTTARASLASAQCLAARMGAADQRGYCT